MKKRLRRRKLRGDVNHLYAAGLAGLCGVGCIGTGIGLPVWSWLHHGHAPATLFYFALWGSVGFMGCAANIRVYFQSIPRPDPPPRGGNKVTSIASLDARRQSIARVEDRSKAA